MELSILFIIHLLRLRRLPPKQISNLSVFLLYEGCRTQLWNDTAAMSWLEGLALGLPGSCVIHLCFYKECFARVCKLQLLAFCGKSS